MSTRRREDRWLRPLQQAITAYSEIMQQYQQRSWIFVIVKRTTIAIASVTTRNHHYIHKGEVAKTITLTSTSSGTNKRGGGESVASCSVHSLREGLIKRTGTKESGEESDHIVR